MGHLGFPQQSSVSSNIYYKTADTPRNPVCRFNPMFFLCFLLLSVDLVCSLQGQSVPKSSFCARQIKPNKEGCVSSKIKSIMLSTRTLGVLDSKQKQFERTAIQISHFSEPVGRQDRLRLGLGASPLTVSSGERLQNQRVCMWSSMFALLLRTLLCLIWFSELHNRMSQHRGYTLLQFIQVFWLWLPFFFKHFNHN